VAPEMRVRGGRSWGESCCAKSANGSEGKHCVAEHCGVSKWLLTHPAN
jgi:hypothetical protein